MKGTALAPVRLRPPTRVLVRKTRSRKRVRSSAGSVRRREDPGVGGEEEDGGDEQGGGGGVGEDRVADRLEGELQTGEAGTAEEEAREVEAGGGFDAGVLQVAEGERDAEKA